MSDVVGINGLISLDELKKTLSDAIDGLKRDGEAVCKGYALIIDLNDKVFESVHSSDPNALIGALERFKTGIVLSLISE